MQAIQDEYIFTLQMVDFDHKCAFESINCGVTFRLFFLMLHDSNDFVEK